MQVSYDNRAITIDGERKLILAGAIHYPRSTPAMWPDLLDKVVESGLNTVETYVFWNCHERVRNVYDFSDRLDLAHFIELCQERGLYFVLRIGPYICAETDYGGFPAWLREVPDMQMRTFNKPFMREMDKWVRFLCDYLKPYFAPNGGPIIAAQVENEYDNIASSYGDEGKRYLEWCTDLAASLDLGIPWVMCEGAAEGAISTLNGTLVHDRLDKHFIDHPEQPAIWTENWVCWYENFGYPHGSRSAEALAYGLARFAAGGGTGSIYYMFHGGTNFNRENVYVQATSYDCDAILDEFGLPRTKYHHCTRLHRILNEYADLLLWADRPKPIGLGPKQVAYVYETRERSIAFVCNDDEKEQAAVMFGGSDRLLAPHSVIVIGDGRVLMDTSKIVAEDVVRRTVAPLDVPLDFAWWREPMPIDRLPAADSVTAAKPINQLDLTHNETDYCWYSTQITIPESGPGTLALNQVGDVAHVFIDGEFAAGTKAPIKEDRGTLESDDFVQSFEIDLQAGDHSLDILCVAVGMIKGDWMIGRQNMALDRKGLWGGIAWNGHTIDTEWTMRPGLVGERARIFADAGSLPPWNDSKLQDVIFDFIGKMDAGVRDALRERFGLMRRPMVGRGEPLRWWRAEFDRPAGEAPLVIDVQGMNKGMLWVNGHCVGRYWVTGPDPDPKAASYDERYTDLMQRYYFVPNDWLSDRNTLVIFEEIGGDPSTIRLCRMI